MNKEVSVDSVKKKRVRRLYCADAIILRGRGYVFVERLTDPTGIALVGGKRKRSESPLTCIRREGREETGTEFVVHRELGTWSGPDRDPRGSSSTTVFVVSALGKLRGEEGKTLILELTEEEACARKDEFVFDHFEIFEYFLNGRGTSELRNSVEGALFAKHCTGRRPEHRKFSAENYPCFAESGAEKGVS